MHPSWQCWKTGWQGSSVYANLCIWPADLKEAAESGPQDTDRAGSARTGKTILIVDDDNQVLKSFSRLLRHSPMERIRGLPTEKARHEFAGTWRKVDLVVTDIKMPGIHGLELISRIRKN